MYAYFMSNPKLHIANVQKDIAIDGQYLLREFISKLAIFFKLDSIEKEMLTESFYEIKYIRNIAPRNMPGDNLRFIAIRNWVRHHIVGQRDAPPLPA